MKASAGRPQRPVPKGFREESRISRFARIGRADVRAGLTDRQEPPTSGPRLLQCPKNKRAQATSGVGIDALIKRVVDAIHIHVDPHPRYQCSSKPMGSEPPGLYSGWSCIQKLSS